MEVSMKNLVVLLSVVLLIPGYILAEQPQIKNIERPTDMPSFLGYVPGRIIVQFKMPSYQIMPAKSRSGHLSLNVFSLDVIAERHGVTGIRQQFPGAVPVEKNGRTIDLSRHYKIYFDPDANLEEVMDAYRNDPNVESVEPIGIHAMYATPNDFYYSYQWHLNQTNDHDIDAPEAWDIEAGNTSVIVAILDSGTRYYHPDLGGVNASSSNPGASRGNMWIKNAELNGSSGVDDDNNGYVDDWIGYDFIDGVSNCWSGEDCNTKDNDPRDFNGHGTHTSGIFGMMTNDDYGMCGVAGGWGNGTQTEYGNGVKIMALRMGYSYNYYGQEYGVVMMDAAAEAFYYAADNGAKIASCSWGSSNSGGIGAAATYFLNSGGIICVAAGNDGAEVSPDYLNGRGDCISVAATDENDNGASFTTYGTWVDICAPGNNIYSTYHDHTDPNTIYWAAMGGTSMATPMVAGVCALIWSQNSSLTASGVTDQLYSSADNIDAYLSSKYVGKMGAGRINAYNAVNFGPPPPVADFTGSPTSGCVPLTVNFTDQSTGDITDWDWDFGDGGSSGAQNPSHQYTSGGTYTVALTVTGPGGSDTETKTNYITVNVAPTAGFTGSPTSGEVPLTVNFTNQSSGAASYLWDFGDTQTSTATNPSHTYTQAGTYTVSLTATNSCGSDEEVKTDYITVTCTPPLADFSGSPRSGEVPLTVDFTDLSTGATSWSWDFGDTQTSTGTNPSHTYTQAGTYTVTLTATNSCGSDDEVKTDYITVTCTPPVADFSGSPRSGEVPLTVNFTDLSTGATSWSWDFGDTQTSTAQNPGHTYTSAGTYTVALTVTNSCGSDTETKTDYITVTCTPPTADFSGSPTSGDAPLTVDFTDLSTGATSWLWDFGDTQTSTAQNPSHTYTVADTYTVTLTVTNSCGSDDEIKSDYIIVTEPGGDYANLPYSTGFETGSFDQYWFTQSSNSEGRILITTANSPHTGSYHMTMDDNRNGSQYVQNEAWLHLNMAGKGDVELAFWWKEFSDESHTQDGVYFSDDGGAGFVKVYNLTGGNSTYREIVLDVDALASSYGLSLTGTFVVKFQQYDNYGISSDGMAFDDISVISLEAPPVADFVGDPTSGVAPLTVNFTDLSSGNPTSWSWSFGDGGTSTAQNPSYEYTDAGTYTVSLTATNAYGSDTETKTGYITVNPPGAWTVITYDDFESGWGSYTDGGNDCARYTGGTYAHQGNCAADIQDNSGTASSFYHTAGYNVSGYTELEVEFWYIAISMDNSNEDFWVQYYDGSSWQTVATFARSIDFNNGVFYNEVVAISSSQYNFPTNAKLRFMCDASGNWDDVYIDEIEFRGMSGTSGAARLADDNPIVPDRFSLHQNYPNPFNPATDISFSLPTASNISLEIYNVLGQRVAVLAEGVYSAGRHTVTWDASRQSSGVYFYRLQADGFVATKKMMLLR
jgi:PKD repeat protein